MKGETTYSLPAPAATIEMAMCRYKTGCKARHCKYKKTKLPCAKMCFRHDCQNVRDEINLQEETYDMNDLVSGHVCSRYILYYCHYVCHYVRHYVCRNSRC